MNKSPLSDSMTAVPTQHKRIELALLYIIGLKSNMTFKDEESKLDPLVMSWDSKHAVTEGGLIMN